jgi:hypothetical protein
MVLVVPEVYMVACGDPLLAEDTCGIKTALHIGTALDQHKAAVRAEDEGPVTISSPRWQEGR